LHRDYQGTILAISDEAGIVLEKRAFDAWGSLTKYWNSNGITTIPTSEGLLLLDRGYTGHEHLLGVGLINMNARLYDPKLHRFLSPDNFVQDPSNSQSFNRYGYCWNNPLKYADYNGEIFGWDDLLVAGIGGVINWAANGCQFNAAGLGYFGTGMAAGIATYYGGPLAGAAVLGAGNSVTKQLSTTGNVDGLQLFGDTLTTVAISGASAGISNYIAPYIDPAINSIVVNSVIRESVKQSISNAISGFAISGVMTYAQTGSFNEALIGALSGAGMGAAMGAANGLVVGYVAVKAKTVSNVDHATKAQAETTTEKNSTAGNNTPNQKGRVGEIAAGIDPTNPKVQIKVNGQTRIPDRLENGFLDEVKNVKQQSFTKQLRDFHKYSIDNGLKMRLYLPNNNTPVSAPLQQQFNNGTIIRMSLNLN
jgi:RHS repeat-associated protein